MTYTLRSPLVAQKFDIQFHQLKMDDKLPEIAEAWGITQVPALVLINEGEIVGKVHGYQPDEILELYIQAKNERKKIKSRENFRTMGK